MLAPLVAEHNPDFLMIQEIKGQAEQFDAVLNDPPGYRAFYHSAEKKGYSGTGIWVSKTVSGGEFVKVFPGNPNPDEGRLAEFRFERGGQKYAFAGIYFPNGGKSEQAWQEKLTFYDRFLEYVNSLRKDGWNCIWGGDVNCAHNEIDLARPKDNEGLIGFHPLERQWLDRVHTDGWRDVFRTLYPDARDIYSWWHQITRSRDRNIGWRIDYFFCDKSLMKDVKRIEYLTEYMGICRNIIPAVFLPSTPATVINSSCITARALLRVTRINTGILNRAIADTVFTAPAPQTAAVITAVSKAGKANIKSEIPDSSLSVVYSAADNNPSIMPGSAPNITDRHAVNRVFRAPADSMANISRPKWSVPSPYSCEAGRNRFLILICVYAAVSVNKDETARIRNSSVIALPNSSEM
ncbi:hypothetical protein CHS0354_002035 [Potamilus streckersoni]|uniref:DNA-(apurinic or apyrimidinic site) endonuclease n=1 Tax=Potamilus streckersoni TaxID=2493646 RepID=A0AAE0T5J3_9BIVA|nr:hypothetical protein CHS0354_002035 [Potamilus streckersoni]